MEAEDILSRWQQEALVSSSSKEYNEHVANMMSITVGKIRRIPNWEELVTKLDQQPPKEGWGAWLYNQAGLFGMDYAVSTLERKI